MILNIKYGKDLITLDKRNNQIRFIEDFDNKGVIRFFNIPCYKWFEVIPPFNSKPLFIKECVKEFLEWELNKEFNINEMEILIK